MIEKPTNKLDEALQSMKPDELSEYYKDNSDYMANAQKSFTYYMKDVIAKKNITIDSHKMCFKDIYSFAGVSESYGEKILNMEKHTKNRDLIIRFCVAGRFVLDEVNRALKLYGMTPLYAKNKRDVCIIVAINNKKYDLIEIDDMLAQQGLARLSKEEK